MVAALQLSIFSTQLFFFLALVHKPSPYRRLYMVPIVAGVIYFFWSALQFHTFLEYTCACLVLSQLFAASDYILLTDVQRELFVKGQKEPAFHLPLIQRVKWAAQLCISCRAVGWSHEPTHALPKRPPAFTTRSSFVFRELGWLACDMMLFEVLTSYTMRSEYFVIKGRSLAVDGFFWRLVNVLVYGNSAIAAIGMSHRMLGILCVLLGVVKPQDWVPLFGSRFDAYSLRNFWGRFWHQILRRQIVSHCRYVTYNLLHMKRRTMASFLVQVYIAFAMTALIHLAGDYSLLGNWSDGRSLRFFMTQPIGITVETIVIEVGKKLGIRGPWHYVGYIWVLLWFTYTVPDWVDPLHHAGLSETSSNFGILDRFLGSTTISERLLHFSSTPLF